MQLQTNKRSTSLLVWGIAEFYFILSVMSALFFGLLSPDIQRQLEIDSTQLGQLGAVFYLCCGVAQLFSGRFVDSIGPRPVLAVSALIASAGLLLLATTQAMQQAMAAQALVGIGFSTAYIGVIYLVGKCFPSGRFSLMSGVSQMLSNTMVAVVIIAMALLGALINFRIVTGALSLVVLLTALLIFFMVRLPPSPAQTESAHQPSVTFIDAIRTLVRIPQVLLGTIYFAAIFGVMLALGNLWNIPTQINVYNHSVKNAAIMNAMFPLCEAVGAIASGWLADHFNRRSTVAKFFMSGSLLFAMILIYGPVLSTSLTFVVIMALGFFFGGAVLGFSLVGQHIPDTLKGTGFGLMTMAAYLLSSLLQFGIGFLLDAIANFYSLPIMTQYKMALSPLILVLLISWVAVFWLRDPRRQAA